MIRHGREQLEYSRIEMKQIFATLMLVLITATGLMAHSKVETSNPADGEILQTAPTAIELNFEKPVRVTKVNLSHKGGDTDHDLRLEIPTKDYVKSMTLTPELYGVGTYLIEWRALAEDGHAMKGDFTFTVKTE